MPALPSPGRAEFIEAMALLASTVHVVTTDGPAGRDGLALTAMCPVSADGETPTLIVCVNAASRPAPILIENGVFCVNTLAEDQSEICDCFAGRLGGVCAHWFARHPWSALATGAPALEEALINLDCRVAGVSRVGTHHVIQGAVLAVRRRPGRPLIHANRDYHRLSV